MKRTLLSSSIELICRFWHAPSIITDPRIGEQIRTAQQIRSNMEGGK